MWSIFTEDLDHCLISGGNKVHIHHIFEGERNRWKCDEDGFIIPLQYDLHNMYDYSAHVDKTFNNQLKVLCQEYWLESGRTKEEFITRYGQWWNFEGPRPAWFKNAKKRIIRRQKNGRK